MAEPASPNRRRAQRLLAGGMAGAHVAALVVVAVAWILAGTVAGVSAAIAAVVVIAFMAIGQAVQLIVADARPKVVLIASLASYAIRVSLLGVLLVVVLGSAERFAVLHPVAVAVATIGVVLGWLVGEFRVYSRLRIPVFDSTEADPPHGQPR
ncbi:MAG: hypothetical protein REI45_12410 [Propionicimonas sp.]|nr:hypothetical protein [Propionicimonas sp.]